METSLVSDLPPNRQVCPPLLPALALERAPGHPIRGSCSVVCAYSAGVRTPFVGILVTSARLPYHLSRRLAGAEGGLRPPARSFRGEGLHPAASGSEVAEYSETENALPPGLRTHQYHGALAPSFGRSRSIRRGARKAYPQNMGRSREWRLPSAPNAISLVGDPFKLTASRANTYNRAN